MVARFTAFWPSSMNGQPPGEFGFVTCCARSVSGFEIVSPSADFDGGESRIRSFWASATSSPNYDPATGGACKGLMKLSRPEFLVSGASWSCCTPRFVDCLRRASIMVCRQRCILAVCVGFDRGD